MLRNSGRFLPLITLLVGALLALLPAPEGLEGLKPYWLALILIFWVAELPARVGLGYAFAIGLAADVINGSLWGEQALRLLIIAFIVLRFRNRLRFFPLWQQALVVTALMLNDRVVALVIRLVTGIGWPDPVFWVSPLMALVFWPLLFLLLDDLRLRAGLR